MKKITPLRAIRLFCFKCQGDDKGSMKSVRLCQDFDCPLYEFRMGHKPKREKEKGIRHLSQEHSKSGRFLPKKTENLKSQIATTDISDADEIILKKLGIKITKIKDI